MHDRRPDPHVPDQNKRLSVNRFHELAEALPQIIWTADPGGTVDYLSQDFYQLTGLPTPDRCARPTAGSRSGTERASTSTIGGAQRWRLPTARGTFAMVPLPISSTTTTAR
jgi:PAS domain-containing protein